MNRTVPWQTLVSTTCVALSLATSGCGEAHEIVDVSNAVTAPEQPVLTYKSADDPAISGDSEIPDALWPDYTPPPGVVKVTANYKAQYLKFWANQDGVAPGTPGAVALERCQTGSVRLPGDRIALQLRVQRIELDWRMSHLPPLPGLQPSIVLASAGAVWLRTISPVRRRRGRGMMAMVPFGQSDRLPFHVPKQRLVQFAVRVFLEQGFVYGIAAHRAAAVTQ